jgi:serpin B
VADPSAATRSADLDALVDAWTGVAVDLFRHLTVEGPLDRENLVLSPSSVAAVLAMILPGARGDTQRELAAALHTGLDPERVAAAAGTLDRTLLEQAGADEPDLRISNAVWVHRGLELREAYERLLVEAFRAGLREADFLRDPEGARQAINRLVAEQTAGKIPELFSAGALQRDTGLVLTSAIYLQARWQEAFDPERTRPEPFHLLGGGTAEVAMLHRQAHYGYAQGDGWRAVELPYRGGRLVMDVLLPAGGAFDGFRSRLDATWLRELLASLNSRELRLALPKFTFDSDLDLVPPLQALGVRSAFGPAADFSGIAGGQPLRLDKVVQRAHVEVDERGTTAAAATGASMRLVSMMKPKPPLELRIDRPFLFAVRDRMSGAPLFVGQVTHPAA